MVTSGKTWQEKAGTVTLQCSAVYRNSLMGIFRSDEGQAIIPIEYRRGLQKGLK